MSARKAPGASPAQQKAFLPIALNCLAWGRRGALLASTWLFLGPRKGPLWRASVLHLPNSPVENVLKRNPPFQRETFALSSDTLAEPSLPPR